MLMQLPVLPAPYSTSLYPELSRVERRELRAALKKRYGRCHWCGRRFGKKASVTLDHIHPLSKGGKNTVDNLALCCSLCNSVKSNHSPTEWLAYLEMLVAELRGMLMLPS